MPLRLLRHQMLFETLRTICKASLYVHVDGCLPGLLARCPLAPPFPPPPPPASIPDRCTFFNLQGPVGKQD